MNNTNINKKSYNPVKKTIHKYSSRSQIDTGVTSPRIHYKYNAETKAEITTLNGKDKNETNKSNKFSSSLKNKKKKQNNETEETDKNTKKGESQIRYKKSIPFNFEKYYERVTKWKEKRYGKGDKEAKQDKQIKKNEQVKCIYQMKKEENEKNIENVTSVYGREKHVKKGKTSIKHKQINSQKETNILSNYENVKYKETKKEKRMNSKKTEHIKKNGVTFAEDTKNSLQSEQSIFCQKEMNPIKSKSVYYIENPKKGKKVPSQITKSAESILYYYCKHNEYSDKTVIDNAENSDFLETYSRSSYTYQQSNTTMNHEHFSSDNIQSMSKPSFNLIQTHDINEHGRNSSTTITNHDTTRKRNFTDLNQSLSSPPFKERKHSTDKNPTREERSSIEEEEEEEKEISEQMKRTINGKKRKKTQREKHDSYSHVYTERIPQTSSDCSEESFDKTFEEEEEEGKEGIAYNRNSINSELSIFIDKEEDNDIPKYMESRKNEKEKEEEQRKTSLESLLEQKTRIEKKQVISNSTPLHNFNLKEENKQNQKKFFKCINDSQSDPDIYYTANYSFELENYPTLNQVNTHKKLIYKSEKQLSNNFDVFLCLFMKYEKRQSQLLCLLMDDEITKDSFFFQKRIKPIIDEYKEAKLKKISERKHNDNGNGTNDGIPLDCSYVPINKFILEIMISIIRKEYFIHIQKLYEQNKKNAVLNISHDLENEFKEINKRLKNWKTQTYEMFHSRMIDKPICHYEKKINLIQKPHWSEPKNLIKLLKKQQHYNPFTIFGTSIKEINLEEIFTLDVYNTYVANEDRMKNIILYELYIKNVIKSLYTKIDESEWKAVLPVLKENWKYFASLECNMLMDPLLLEEILWYLDTNKMYRDKSNDMFFYETCFCPTPNPQNQNNLNDIKNWNTLINQKYICNKETIHRQDPLYKDYFNQSENLIFTYDEMKLKNKYTQGNKNFIYYIPRPSSALCYDSDFFKKKTKKFMKQKYKCCTENFSTNITPIQENPYIQNHKSQEWISQNFFDNFFFNYYTYNFNNHKCKCNSII